MSANTQMEASSYLWLSCSMFDNSLTFSASCTFSLSPSISFLSSSTSVWASKNVQGQSMTVLQQHDIHSCLSPTGIYTHL